jgi:signal peptidase II
MRRILLIVLTLTVCVGCDWRTKSLAATNLRGREPMSFLADTLRLEYAENQGGFLGLGDSLPAGLRTGLFTYACTAGVAALLAYLFIAARLPTLQVLALSLIAAGGIGNLIDRISWGYVRDFLNVGLGPIRTGIFNVADAAMMAGCILILVKAASPVRPPARSPN